MTMMAPQYICCLYLATAGQQGNNLGSDEEEIVLLIYIIIDVTKNQVIGARQYLVRPTVADVNENLLSEQVQISSLLTEEMVKNAGQPLDTALYEFDRYVRESLNIDITDSTNFQFVTDGQLPLRQCLYPECFSKCIDVNNYYTLFYDLRKEVFKYLSAHNKLTANGPTSAMVNISNEGTLTTQPNNNGILNNNNNLNSTNNNSLLQIATNGINDQQQTLTTPLPTSIGEMLDLLGLNRDTENEFYIKEAKDMANIIQNLIANGHIFENPETINLTLEPGICFKSDKIEKNCVVRARGLPWQSSDQDIAKFFIGLNIAKGGVALCLSSQGRRNGEALIRFCSQEHRDLALKRHKHHMSKRYIEIYEGNGDDFISVAGGSSSEAQTFLSKGAAVIIRMRGLPYDCTAQQVLDFFSRGDQDKACYALDGVDGVLFVKKADGRSTGDAFVLFPEESDASKALSKHRELIGSRYIELFRSTTAEVQQVLNRSMMDPKAQPATNIPVPNIQHSLTQLAQIHLPSPALPSFPQRIITSGTRKDCIRLRGLPYEAQVEHILEFLGECSTNIVYQGVHMVYSSSGLPSGEAFIQMDSEKNAAIAAQSKHHRNMYFGKKQRYIEVFQCSGEDMHLVLTGGIPIPTSPIKYHDAYNAQSMSPLSPDGAMMTPLPPGPSNGLPQYTPYVANGPQGPQGPPGPYLHQGPMLLWPYPSPPVSPTSYYCPPPPIQGPIQPDYIRVASTGVVRLGPKNGLVEHRDKNCSVPLWSPNYHGYIIPPHENGVTPNNVEIFMA